jgi:tetratricopeptide (TPR) repeat protein
LGLDHTGHASTARVLQALALREGGRPLEALTLQASTEGGKPRLSERIQYANTLLQLGRLDGLTALLDELLVASRPLGANAKREVRLLQVQALTDLGRLPEAGAALADADALFATLRAETRYAAHRLLLAQGQWALAAGDLVRAQGVIDEAGSVVAATGQSDDPAWHKIHQLQARVYLANGRAADALKAANDALDWSQRMAIDPDASLHVANDRLLRAQAQHMLGNAEAARTDAVLAERQARAAGGADHPLVRLAHAESLS